MNEIAQHWNSTFWTLVDRILIWVERSKNGYRISYQIREVISTLATVQPWCIAESCDVIYVAVKSNRIRFQHYKD